MLVHFVIHRLSLTSPLDLVRAWWLGAEMCAWKSWKADFMANLKQLRRAGQIWVIAKRVASRRINQKATRVSGVLGMRYQLSSVIRQIKQMALRRQEGDGHTDPSLSSRLYRDFQQGDWCLSIDEIELLRAPMGSCAFISPHWCARPLNQMNKIQSSYLAHWYTLALIFNG